MVCETSVQCENVVTVEMGCQTDPYEEVIVKCETREIEIQAEEIKKQSCTIGCGPDEPYAIKPVCSSTSTQYEEMAVEPPVRSRPSSRPPTPSNCYIKDVNAEVVQTALRSMLSSDRPPSYRRDRFPHRRPSPNRNWPRELHYGNSEYPSRSASPRWRYPLFFLFSVLYTFITLRKPWADL